jgi:hypothetical protein
MSFNADVIRSAASSEQFKDGLDPRFKKSLQNVLISGTFIVCRPLPSCPALSCFALFKAINCHPTGKIKLRKNANRKRNYFPKATADNLGC